MTRVASLVACLILVAPAMAQGSDFGPATIGPELTTKAPPLLRGPFAWDQLAGGPERAADLRLGEETVLDVLSFGTIPGDFRGGVYARFAPGLLVTPHGLVATTMVEGGGITDPTWPCVDILITGNRDQTTLWEGDCAVVPSLSAYLPGEDLVLVCRGGHVDEPILEARHAGTWEIAWSLTAQDLAPPDAGVGLADAWNCGAAGWIDPGVLYIPVSPGLRPADLWDGTTNPAPIQGYIATITPNGDVIASTMMYPDCYGTTLVARCLPSGWRVHSIALSPNLDALGDVSLIAMGEYLGYQGLSWAGDFWANSIHPVDINPDCQTCGNVLLDARSGSPWPVVREGAAYALLGSVLHAVDPTEGPSGAFGSVDTGIPCPTGRSAAPLPGEVVVVPACSGVLVAFQERSLEHLWTWQAPRGTSISQLAGLPSEDVLVVHAASAYVGASIVDSRHGTTLREIPLPMEGRLPFNGMGIAGDHDLPLDGPGSARTAGVIPLGDGEHIIVWSEHSTGVDWTLLGPRDAADLPPIDVSNGYPRRDEPVVLGLPTPANQTTRFIVSWGDGAVLETVGGKYVSHAFSDTGLREISVTMVAAGLTATNAVQIDVGGTPPPEPRNLNWIQERFEPDEQETTYFALGLIVTFLGAMFAVWRLRRRRSRLRRELRHVQEAADAAKNPAGRAAAMQERRAHVRGLLMGGRIDESQLKVLEDRIDELARGGRIESMRGRFDFLPYGFVQQVQEMLADGRLSGWEYDQLDKLLAADSSLTGAQKKRVRGLLRDWAKEDAG